MLFQRNLQSKSKKADGIQTHMASLENDIDYIEEKKGAFCVGNLSRYSLRRRVLPRLCFLFFLALMFWEILYLHKSAISVPTSDSTSNDHAHPNNGGCDGYKGIYHIEKGDIGGAAGTIFFQFVIGQIIWAEENNFKPWVHLNNVSYIVYDPGVHGNSTGVDVKMLKGMKISYVQRPKGHRRDAKPGPPIGDPKTFTPYNYHFDGDGVWNNYFEPVSDFTPGDKSCENKPLVTMDLYLVTPGVHGFSGAPKAWRYEYLPDYITKPHVPLNDWLAPQRHTAHDVLKRYIRFLPHIKENAEIVNPYCSIENSCLGLHIRHSDKAAGRRQLDTDDFLPYVEAFLASGGKWVYLATDSSNVVEHIKSKWPDRVLKVIRSMGDDIVRSNSLEAVFDIGSHHRTNEEILVEILALSKCQFLIHGLSAVTESSIWINIDLHYTSVNLEDPQHLEEKDFEYLVVKVLNGGNASQILSEKNSQDWWLLRPKSLDVPINVQSCNSIDGILQISNVGSHAGTGTAFFTSVLNQLIYAEAHNLKPWVYLSNTSSYIYDDEFHGTDVSTIQHVTEDAKKRQRIKNIELRGNGIWTSYFQPVSDYAPDNQICKEKPIFSLTEEMVDISNSLSPASSKTWQYDDIPDNHWNPGRSTLKLWYEPMRVKANEIVKKYFAFHPFLLERARQVNPVDSTSVPCLAVHLRNSDKEGIHRKKFPVNKFREYLQAFSRAGGKHIYIASDSHKSVEYIMEHFPPKVTEMIRTQGPYVVRSSWKWPAHMLEKHHRTNSEALVDVLAMSKCQLLLHGHSAISEAAVYLNLNLHNQSVNLEDPDKSSAKQFEVMAKEVIESAADKTRKENPESTGKIKGSLGNVRIIQGNLNRKCKRNAIVYLAQKIHSTYGRDSFALLLKSLKLVNTNYLSLNNHGNNTDVIIFHTADFTKDDMNLMENEMGASFRDSLYFVDIHNTPYWERPSWHSTDNPEKDWFSYPEFPEGYRRMIHFFAIDIWSFFRHYGKEKGCEYEYIMRFDEDSFLWSPIEYDIFDYMKRNDYNYGFRLCAYEMMITQRMMKIWRKSQLPAPVREIDLELCGMYNNFFVAKLSFFQSNTVQKFVKLVDRQGLIYRRRFGDLQIHSMAVYGFSPPEKIHRFLDFTYEHGTSNKEGCIIWGGIQAGYNDPNAGTLLENYLVEKVYKNKCTDMKGYVMNQKHLSPNYHHLPDRLNGTVTLRTIMAGCVEKNKMGILSG